MEAGRVRKVVLPAAGLGTRLRPLTAALPKEMLPVGRRLVIQRVLEECEAAGLDQVLAVISRRKMTLLDALEPEDVPLDAQQMPRRLVYTILQRVQGGLGHAILHAEGFAAGESFAVALPDTLVVGGDDPVLARLVRIHQEAGAAATIAAEEVAPERACRYGIMAPAGGAAEAQHGGTETRRGKTGDFLTGSEDRRDQPEERNVLPHRCADPVDPVDPINPGKNLHPSSVPPRLHVDTFRIADVVEKPSPGTEPSRLAISARYVFSPTIFPALRRLQPGTDGELQLTDAIRDLAKQGLPVLGVRLAVGERRLDIGSFDSYREAVEAVAREEAGEAGG